MGRHFGPKARVNRRLNAQIYESAGAIRAFERRPQPPGMHTRRGKLSTYGYGLYEKQKIKHFYGLRERQLRKYYDMASRRAGNTGDNMLLLCERRLDNVIRRAGFVRSRLQARQGVVHCHFTVNGVKTNKPSFLVRPGDVIEVRKRKNLEAYYSLVLESSSNESAGWVSVDADGLRITVVGYPGHEDISLPVDILSVVEFMSR
jgi:small subunit ribosomal protein S4